MVVVVQPPSESESCIPIFVFADEDVLQRSNDWKNYVAQRKAETLSVPTPTQEAIDKIRGAQVVVLGGKCHNLAEWKKFDLGRAVTACHAAGGLIATVGQVLTPLLGSWYMNEDKSVQRGWNLIHQAVINIVRTDRDKQSCEDIVASLHEEGHEAIKGFMVVQKAGAAFFSSGDASRAEPIGKTLTEACSIPKANSLGKLLRIRKHPVPDPDIVAQLGIDPEKRWNSALNIVAKWLVQSNGTVVASTGAGISAESGIPTYRDPGGLWEIYDQMEVSHIKGFARDPLRCWRFELELYQLLKNCGPNAAHIALKNLEDMQILKYVVTQNVDGLHLAAGSKRVLEIHGSETRGICMRPDCRKTLPYFDVFRSLGWIDESGTTTDAAPALPAQKRVRVKGGVYAELSDSSSSSQSSTSSEEVLGSSSSGDESCASSASKASKGPIKFKAIVKKLKEKTTDADVLCAMDQGPRCPVCKEGLMKPDAVYFEEPLPRSVIQNAIKSSSKAKAFLIVGTSGQVAPACKLPVYAKVKAGGRVIEVSPRETDMTEHADILFHGSAATVLPALVDAVKRVQDEMAEHAGSQMISSSSTSSILKGPSSISKRPSSSSTSSVLKRPSKKR